jgi:hypothetical protein
VRLSSFASFSSFAFRAGLTLRFSCALRIIIAGLIWSRGDTMYYKKWPAREGIVAIVIISSAICLVLGGSIGFLFGAICTMASDKNQQARMPPNHQYLIPQREVLIGIVRNRSPTEAAQP